MWFKSVVFPAPRKPVNTVTGTRVCVAGMKGSRWYEESGNRGIVPLRQAARRYVRKRRAGGVSPLFCSTTQTSEKQNRGLTPPARLVIGQKREAPDRVPPASDTSPAERAGNSPRPDCNAAVL